MSYIRLLVFILPKAVSYIAKMCPEIFGPGGAIKNLDSLK